MTEQQQDAIDQANQSTATESLGIDAAILTPIVRRALGRETIEVTDWDCQPIHGGASMTSQIFRFTGHGRDQGETVPWSLILKVILSEAHSTDPQGGIRERLVYQSGLLDDLPGGLAAPRCFGVIEQEDGAFWIWLEEIVEDVEKWPLERYGLAARHLGQFNGAYLAGKPLPSEPWLSKGWLRTLVDQAAPTVAQVSSLLADGHPQVCRMLPNDLYKRDLLLWEEREVFLDAMDRLPQTFCHMDAFRRNLFARRDADDYEQTVAADWAFTGIGAIGEELAPFVLAASFDDMDWTLQTLEETALEGYLEGLHDAGWRGDPRMIQLSFGAASALRYRFGTAEAFLVTALDESQYTIWEQVMGRPFEKLLDDIAENGHYLHDKADEARVLLPSFQ